MREAPGSAPVPYTSGSAQVVATVRSLSLGHNGSTHFFTIGMLPPLYRGVHCIWGTLNRSKWFKSPSMLRVGWGVKPRKAATHLLKRTFGIRSLEKVNRRETGHLLPESVIVSSSSCIWKCFHTGMHIAVAITCLQGNIADKRRHTMHRLDRQRVN